MKKSTKLLVLLLSVVLICAGLVIATSADTSTPGASYVDANGKIQTATDLATAIANAKEGTTVTLTGDTTVSESINVTKTITIDLNGYTLTTTCNKVFVTDTNHKDFTIKGNGTISAVGRLINNTKKNYTQNFTIAGGDKGMTITHDGTVDKSLVYASSGNWNFSNLSITSINLDGGKLIQTADRGGMYSLVKYAFNGVTISAKAANKNDTSAILYVGGQSTVTLNYCNFSGDVSAFTFETQQDGLDIDGDGDKSEYMQTGDFLVINNSYINMSHGYTENDKNDEIGVFGAYGNIGGNIIVNDSWLRSSGRPVLLNNTMNNGAIVLNNSILEQNGTHKQPFARSANIVVNAGSALVYPTDYNNYLMSHGGYTVTLKKGARLDADVYNSIVTNGKTGNGESASDNTVVYADGSSVKDSTTYKIIYDTSVSVAQPYVVVDYDYTPAVEDPAYTYILHTSMKATTTVWNGSGTYGDVSTYNNSYFQFVSNGKKASSGKMPEFLFYNNGITQNAYDVVVVETDFAGDMFNGFSGFKLGLQTNGKNTGLFNVKNDGTLTYSVSGGTNAPTKLATDSWHRVSIVVDIKNGNTVYCYIDGTYVGSISLGTDVVNGGTGPRFSVDGVDDAGTALLVDNVSVRAYGDGTGTKLTDNGAKYLGMGGGAPINQGAPASNVVTVATTGFPVGNVNDMPGVNLNVNRDVRFAQKVTADGVSVNPNGYNFTYTNDSLPVYITRDASGVHTNYNFSSAHVVSYKFFFGNIGDASQLADEAYWTEISCKLGYSPAASYNGPAVTTANGVVVNNHWYNINADGWATELFGASVDVIYPELADAKFYPYATLAYDFVVLNSDGSFNRGLTGIVDGNGNAWGSGLKKVLLAYGETLVIQKDFKAQAALNYIWNQGSKVETATNKTLSIDFNGHTLKVDTNLAQSGDKYNSATDVMSIAAGETLNVYSSYPGGKLENYGVKDGKAVGGRLFHFNAGEKVANDKAATINKNADGATTQHNATLNVGTVTVNGNTIPGSNLTLSASAILNAETGDSTCKINIDGVTAVRNSADFSGMFVNRVYFGEINVTNCVIVNPVNSTIVDGHSEGIVDTNGSGANDLNDTRALAKMVFDGCTIITKDDGGNIVAGNWSFQSLIFKNCTTNGRVNGSNLANVVGIAEGNTYATRGASVLNGNTEVIWNNGMTLGGADTITVEYITLNPDVAVTSRDWDYISHTYTVAINGYTGEADHVLPVLTTKTVIKGEELTVTFKGVADEGKTYKYATGATLTEIPELNSYNGTVVTFTPDGTYDKEVATVVTKSVVYTPNYTAKANITGLKANLSLYANFNVNLYVPAAYKEFVTVAGYEYTEVKVGEVDYLQVTAEQLCSNAAEGIVFTLNVNEAGYETETTVTVSIVSYADTILGGEYTDADKVLMCYMLGYANEAEKFFDGAANETVTALLTQYADYTAKYNYVKDYDNKNVTNTGLSSVFTSASVSLKSAPAFVLILKDGFAGTVTVKYGTNNVRTYNVTADTARTITIEGMKVYNFGTYLEITASGTIGTENVEITNGKYTLDTFAAYHEANANNENSATATDSAACLDLIAALSAYAEVAELYKTGALADALVVAE